MAEPAYLEAKVAGEVEDVEVGGGVEGEGVVVEGHAGQPAELGVGTEVPPEHLDLTRRDLTRWNGPVRIMNLGESVDLLLLH